MKNAQVLIVDDDPALLQALPETIRSRIEGVTVDTADSARAALERIEAIDYDVIITDIKMPAMDGLLLLKEIKRIRPQTPTLLITGHGEHDLAVQGLRGGAYDFIQKPIERDYFIASLGRALKVRQLSREVEEQRAALARHNEELQRNREELRALTARLITVQEEERRRLSFELHDDLNQKLAVLVMNIDALERVFTKDPVRAREDLRALRNQIAELSDDVRSLAYRLHPSILDHLGLAIALESYSQEFAKREKIRVSFSHKNLPDSIPQDIATCLYRVAQEGLRNVAKHARAVRVIMKLEGVDDCLELTIKDSGVGFNPEERQGLGLLSMQERVRLVQGTFTLRSRPGYGTLISARVPVRPSPTQTTQPAPPASVHGGSS